MDKPNVVLLTIDTFRADRLGCHGNLSSLTPNLDRLAEQGVRFSQAITCGSWTQAAFPGILTSTYASMYGGCLGPLSPERPSPVEELARQGYATAGFTTSPLLGRAYAYERGFEFFHEFVPDESDPWLRSVKGGQRLLRQPLTHRIMGSLGQASVPARLYVSAEEVNQKVGGWLGDVHSPFFAWIHYMDVHWPYHLAGQVTGGDSIAQLWADLAHLYDVNWHGQEMTGSQREYYVSLYERAVQYADVQVGQLMQLLQQAGFGDNTIVVVVADHGEEFLEHGHWGHLETNLHDEIVRVPLLMRLPKRMDGRIVDEQVSTLDIMPTIFELCGFPEIEEMEGESLVPLWSGNPTQDGPRYAISERWRDIGDVSHMIAVRSNSFKLIWDDRRPDRPRLHDLHKDPGEKEDVSEQYPEIAKSYMAQVDQHRQRAMQRNSSAPHDEPQLDSAIIERLRGLGYVE